jgi:hypothetical protein
MAEPYLPVLIRFTVDADEVGLDIFTGYNELEFQEGNNAKSAHGASGAGVEVWMDMFVGFRNGTISQDDLYLDYIFFEKAVFVRIALTRGPGETAAYRQSHQLWCYCASLAGSGQLLSGDRGRGQGRSVEGIDSVSETQGPR